MAQKCVSVRVVHCKHQELIKCLLAHPANYYWLFPPLPSAGIAAETKDVSWPDAKLSSLLFLGGFVLTVILDVLKDLIREV